MKTMISLAVIEAMEPCRSKEEDVVILELELADADSRIGKYGEDVETCTASVYVSMFLPKFADFLKPGEVFRVEHENGWVKSILTHENEETERRWKYLQSLD